MSRSPIADMVLYDSDGHIKLIVEVKGRTNTTRSGAQQVRRNMLAHGAVPDSRFLLLAFPDRLYLWKDADNTQESAEPAYEIDAAPFFRPYFEKAGVSPGEVSRQGFELIVTSWLNELVNWGISDNVPEPQKRSLQESGLVEAVKGGRVAVEVPL